jgi:putative ABC transport system permease protein
MIFVRNVLRAPARSLLTVLGVASGVALFVAVRAITIDIRAQVSAVADAYGLEVVLYERRANSPFTSRISAAQMSELQARFGSALSPMVLGTHNEPWSSYALVIGVTQEFLRRIPLVAGAPYAEGSGEMIIGEVAARQLGVEPDQTLSLDGRPVRIAGIFRTGSRLLDGGLMMDIPQAQAVLTQQGAEPQYSLAVIRTVDEASTRRLIDEVDRSYPAFKAIPGSEFAGAMRLMHVVDAFVRTLAAIALVGTCLVVMNTLLMAIGERTREIGILMTVGWTPPMVLRMFLAESVALCVVGAGLGNVLALLLLRVVNSIESIGFGWIPIRFPLSLTGTSFVVALSVAVLSLAWPAVVLYRVQPLSALRHE